MKKLILTIIKYYQKYLSPDQGLIRRIIPLPKTCRFTPTCSQYTYTAIERYGIIVGSWLGIKRIIRCNPWNKGGWDPVK